MDVDYTVILWQGENSRLFSSLINMELINRSVRSFSSWEGERRGEWLFYPAAFFTLLENMKN